jgi:hypothetical protein
MTTTTTYYLGTLPNGTRITVTAPRKAPKLRYMEAAHALQAENGWTWSEATALLAELKFPGYGDVRDENHEAGVNLAAASQSARFLIEPAKSPRGMWTIRDTQTGETSGLYGSAAAAGPVAERRESETTAAAETVGEWITVTDLGRPVQAQVIRKSHASTDVETIGGKVWRFHSAGRELANAKFVRQS